MATTTTTTTTTINNNRIPLSVSHGGATTTNNNSANYEYRSNNNGAATTNTTYDMRNMNEETDKIKLRMREFEERCKKWREDFFNNQNCQDCDGNQRVPFTGQNTVNIDNNNNNGYGASPNKSGVNGGGGAPFHSSTMHHAHRINIEDTPNGGKKYKIEFEIGDFKQNELQISTHGSSTLVVKGDRELKAGHATETKTFNREITLPDYVDVGKMNAYLLDQHSENNVLIVEAPVVMEKYAYRRSAFDKSQSPVRITSTTAVRAASPLKQQQQQQPPQTSSILKTSQSTGNSGVGGLNELSTSSSSATHHHHHHHQSSESKSSTTTKVVRDSSGGGDFVNSNTTSHYRPSNDTALNLRASRSNLSSTVAPELIKGYPVYDPVEASVVYKFDLGGFDQSEIQLTITVDRTLEIKATKELQDHLGKIYREFKREIHLESDVDLNAIKNVLHEGILTLKIPKQNRPDGMGSMSNSHNLQSPNGFKEFYNDEGKLTKLSSDFRGYSPENVKIVLSANNVLKVTAQQTEQSPNGKGTVQKECTRHYTLPAWIQPENMKAIMSRDGILNVDIKH